MYGQFLVGRGGVGWCGWGGVVWGGTNEIPAKNPGDTLADSCSHQRQSLGTRCLMCGSSLCIRPVNQVFFSLILTHSLSICLKKWGNKLGRKEMMASIFFPSQRKVLLMGEHTHTHVNIHSRQHMQVNKWLSVIRTPIRRLWESAVYLINGQIYCPSHHIIPLIVHHLSILPHTNTHLRPHFNVQASPACVSLEMVNDGCRGVSGPGGVDNSLIHHPP